MQIINLAPCHWVTHYLDICGWKIWLFLVCFQSVPVASFILIHKQSIYRDLLLLVRGYSDNDVRAFFGNGKSLSPKSVFIRASFVDDKFLSRWLHDQILIF